MITTQSQINTDVEDSDWRFIGRSIGVGVDAVIIYQMDDNPSWLLVHIDTNGPHCIKLR